MAEYIGDRPVLREYLGYKVVLSNYLKGSRAMDSFVEPSSIADYAARMGAGFNIGNYLDSAVIGAPGGWINSHQLFAAKSANLLHVRLPVNFAAHADASGVISEAFFTTYVDPLVIECLSLFERVVLDMHGYLQLMNHHAYGEFPIETKFFTVDQHIVRLRAMWYQIATRYCALSKRLSFDLLNEPYANTVSSANLNTGTPVGITSDQWNVASALLISDIRSSGGNNSSRVLWVETYSMASAAALGALILPSDTEVGVSVHIYDPFAYTHQASGAGTELTSAGVRLLKWSLENAKNWGAVNNRIIYVGESGANKNSSYSNRVTYYQALKEYQTELRIPIALWDWNTDFGVYKADSSEWLPGMFEAISGAPPLAKIYIPEDTTPDGVYYAGTPSVPALNASFSLDQTTRTISWGPIGASAKTANFVVPGVVLANGQKWTVYAKQYSMVARIGLNVLHYSGATHDSTDMSGYLPSLPGGYSQPISGVNPDGNSHLCICVNVSANAAAGSITYAVWQDA